MKRPGNVLTAVLAAHGGRCACHGACGKTHTGDDERCNATHSAKNKPLLAAPQTPHASEVQNAAAPLAELRPWCWACWRDALAAERARVSEQRSQELADMQIDLFDIGTDTAA
ncbi:MULTISPECIES: hypothetical protein [Streptomyces]|uniref:hypothetical protein n=1 Tax=Streptomyces TaxID=1883 RepID=UPI00073DB7FE|nr:hypothetical protein [Streptomyces sp. FBKL.4005]OYP10263.1 hypothetical protein CFC35_41470 [Streptomyces sp. FBKL.4005]CUW33414.1 hypothetical protein TUE45_pSRTUE45a_0046 [Streptomyces reticuli]